MFGVKNITVRIRSRLKGLPRDAGWRLGINQPFYRNARGARILVYHGICINNHLRYNTTFITARTFEQHLKLYKKYFNVIPLDDFYQQKFSANRFNLCLSFDDGLTNNYKYVLPLLNKYEVPAAFFITAIRDGGYDILWNDMLNISYQSGPEKLVVHNDEFERGNEGRYVSIKTGQHLADRLRSMGFEAKAEMIHKLGYLRQTAEPDYWLQMTEDEIKILSANKWVTIGSHGYYHNDLAKISITSAKEELAKSKQWLENITGNEIKAMAFPYGSYSNELLTAAKSIGYSQLLATEFLFPGDDRNELLRERLTINPFISNINQLHANITGSYQ